MSEKQIIAWKTWGLALLTFLVVFFGLWSYTSFKDLEEKLEVTPAHVLSEINLLTESLNGCATSGSEDLQMCKVYLREIAGKLGIEVPPESREFIPPDVVDENE